MTTATALAANPDTRTTPSSVSVATLYRQMWHYATGARAWLLLSSAMLIASQLVKLLVPWFTAQAINTLQAARPGAAAACLPWVGGIVGVYVLCWALHGPGRVIERRVSLRVRHALADRLYARVVQAPLTWHAAHHPAELAHRMSQATHALTNFTQSQFIYLQNAVNLAGPVLALWWLSKLTGAAAIVGFGVVAATIGAFDRAMMRLAREENGAERALAAALLDCLGNITTVLALRLNETTRRLLERRLQAVMAPLQRSITLTEWKWCAVDLLGVLLSWGLVGLYAWQVSGSGGLMLGGVFMVFQYAQQAGGVIGSLASNLQNFARFRTDFASAAPIWEAPRQHAPTDTMAGTADSPAWRHLDLCHVSFHHPAPMGGRADEAQPAGLRHVSLRLHAGERVALVGASGCGKSTLLRLLAGLHQPSHGHIEIDGVAALRLQELGRCATLIPQDAQMFAATLRENIGFDHGHSEIAIAAAAQIGALDGLIAELPLGLDTHVAQGGSNLSGGQRQRVALTRGVLAAAGTSMLLLDEPTSALDPVTEGCVHDRLRDAFPRACIVTSVHRMSLLERFDRVVLMAHGRVVDTGTAAELAIRQQLFRDMLGAEAAPQAEGPIVSVA